MISFARDSRGRLRAERGLDWDTAELSVVPGLRDLGFVSPQVLPVACRYHHAWRDQELSDHSALEADLA